jgi:hypothetical protein
MQFKLEFVLDAEDDRLLEAVNEYLYHSYKDLSEVPEDEICSFLMKCCNIIQILVNG